MCFKYCFYCFRVKTRKKILQNQNMEKVPDFSQHRDMMVGRCHLQEKIEIYAQVNGHFIVHTRIIDDLIYTVEKLLHNGEIENLKDPADGTNISGEDLKTFKENWDTMWTPPIQEIKKILET